MGERRKRKSAWEEDDTKHMPEMSEPNSWTEDRRPSHGSGHYNEVSESKTRKSKDKSEWPAWESIEEHPNVPADNIFKNSHDRNELGAGKRYYKNMSPGFDEIGLHNQEEAHEYGQSRHQRYPGRGRSRSRSRSRSLSRGRERERERERRRSRSRSRPHVKAKDYTRIRSPINSRQPYESSDRRTGDPEKSSQICRDFPGGNCRRGGQCRFYHPSTSSRRDRDIMEDDLSESWRSRTDYNRGSRHSYISRSSSGFESRHDVSDPYHDDRRSLPCKDFLKGNCRWGDTCRFSHRGLSDDGYGHGTTGNVSFDKGKNGKPLCKFFASGKCSRENCWFSHEDPHSNDKRGVVTTERRPHDKRPTFDDVASKIDDRDDGSWKNENKTNNERRGAIATERRLHDKSNGWDGWGGPTWDDAATKIDDRGWESENNNWGKIETTLTGENGSYGRNEGKIGSTFPGETDKNTVFYEPIANENENKNSGKIGENENKIWGKSESTFPGESRNSGENTSFYEPVAKENENQKWGKIESDLSEKSGRNTGLYEHIPKENMDNKQGNLVYGSELQDHYGIENVGGENASEQNFFPDFQNQQLKHYEVIRNNSFAPRDEVNETATNLIPFSVRQNASSVFPGHSSISSGSDRGQNLLLPNNPSNGFRADLNEPKSDIVDPSNVQTHTQNNQKVSQSPRFLEAKVPELLSSLLTEKLSNQLAHFQTYAETPSIPVTSGSAPLANASSVQTNLSAVSIDLNSMGNDREDTEHGNLNLAPRTEHISQTQIKQSSSPKKVISTGFDSSKARLEDLNKGVEESKRFENHDGHERGEEVGAAIKDEKGMRLFKNNLVEFVKEILKPTWKEGRMSRDDHKTVVRKVVDKVSSTIQVEHIPKTQEKVDLYLACSKPKITKLVQAYVERFQKKDS